MNQPAETQPKPEPYVPMTAANLTQPLIDEAVAQARRFDRNFANREGTDAIPVPARMCRLMALTIINLHEKVSTGGKVGKAIAPAPAEPLGKPVKEKAAKAPAKKKTAPAAQKTGKKAVAKKSQSGPALTAEQRKAFDTVKDIVAAKEVVTTRRVAELGGWASHNTGARHLKSLIDLGYLKKVGKQQVIALTGLEP